MYYKKIKHVSNQVRRFKVSDSSFSYFISNFDFKSIFLTKVDFTFVAFRPFPFLCQ